MASSTSPAWTRVTVPGWTSSTFATATYIRLDTSSAAVLGFARADDPAGWGRSLLPGQVGGRPPGTTLRDHGLDRGARARDRGHLPHRPERRRGHVSRHPDSGLHEPHGHRRAAPRARGRIRPCRREIGAGGTGERTRRGAECLGRVGPQMTYIIAE